MKNFTKKYCLCLPISVVSIAICKQSRQGPESGVNQNDDL